MVLFYEPTEEEEEYENECESREEENEYENWLYENANEE